MTSGWRTALCVWEQVGEAQCKGPCSAIWEGFLEQATLGWRLAGREKSFGEEGAGASFREDRQLSPDCASA